MGTWDRRTFLKRSAILTATAAVGGSLLPPEAGAEAPGGPRNPITRQAAPSAFFAAAKNRPEVIAHRGGNLQWPGETMFAFEEALKLGADVLEMDVYRTRDRPHLVLMHNPTVNATTEGGHRLVNMMTLEELKRLNAGHRWKDESGKNPFEGRRFAIPTLEEVFDAFPNARMNIEMKIPAISPVKELCDLIERKRMTDKVLVASFSHRYLERFRERCPGAATSASLFELIQYLGRPRPLKAQAIQLTPELELRFRELKLSWPVMSREFVRRAQEEFKLKVHAWTINECEEVRRMRDFGVDGIITDHPARLLSALGRGASGLCP